MQRLLHSIVGGFALVLSYSDQPLNRLLLSLLERVLIFAEISPTFMFLLRFVLIELGKKFLILLILWDAPLFYMECKRYDFEGVAPQSVIVPAHIVK